MSSPMPSRRGLIAASAWTVPAVVLASSAPAFAASGSVCGPIPYRVNWSTSNYRFFPTRTSTPYGAGRGLVTASPAGVVPTELMVDAQPLVVTVTNTLNGSRARGANASDGAGNMQVSPFNVGGLNAAGLTVMQDFGSNTSIPTPRSAQGQTLTLQFSRPVKGLQFTITDIDSSRGQYRDRVQVNPPPADFTAARSWLYGSVLGDGTSEEPWRNSSTDNPVNPETSGRGNVQLRYDAEIPISTVEVRFWNDQSGSLTGNGLQGIFLSSLTFTAETC